MKRIYFTIVTLLLPVTISLGQISFPSTIRNNYSNKTVVMPPSPLQFQLLFIGGVDSVATLGKDGKPNGYTIAREGHDFIGFTPDTAANTTDLGWITVNHETMQSNNMLGDGGGMTVFKVRRDPDTDTLIVVHQTLADGRTGKFFNVDFANTVGETGINCGGIVSLADGRIWTAEEAIRPNNSSIWQNGTGIRDTSDFTISTTINGDFNGKTINRFQNFNWMVEIDPRTAKAVRKQYNWGRQSFEGGVILPDNKTVYLGEDNTPGLFTKFVADVAGDFTKGKTYVYKHDATGEDGPWISIDNTRLDNMLNIRSLALRAGATMFNRLEWVAYNQKSNKIYFSETGRDNLSITAGGGVSRGIFESGRNADGTLNPHWATAYRNRFPEFKGSDAEAIELVRTGKFNDYYGRVLEFDPKTGIVRTYLEGGPYLPTSPSIANYPEIHLANPDGLSILYIKNKAYLVIQEDLNDVTFGRMPLESSIAGGFVCEMFLLDLSIRNPSLQDLIKISATPQGAEITGACTTPDGKTILASSQHPISDRLINTYPYNHALVYAISG